MKKGSVLVGLLIAALMALAIGLIYACEGLVVGIEPIDELISLLRPLCGTP